METISNPNLNQSNINKLCLSEYFDITDPLCFDLISNFSLPAYGIIFLKNEIVLNKRKNIIEFGSGLSTLLMALVLEKYKLDGKIITVESGVEWVNVLADKIDQLQLSEYVKIIHAPLINEGYADQWYDRDILNREIDTNILFDLVLIDGPVAFKPEIAKCRYEAIPFLQGRLATNNVIILDDANRKGEREIVDLWNTEYGLDFTMFNNRFAVCWNGYFIKSNPSILSCLMVNYKSL